MAFKIVLLAALVGCCSAAFRQQSAASPTQIAFAESQEYDQTGPGIKNAQQQSITQYSQQPQVYSNLAQDYSQVQYQQPAYPQFQDFAQQPVHSQAQVFSQPQAFAQPQVFAQSQVYQSQPEQAFSGLQYSQASQVQPSQFAYSAQPQISYPAIPQSLSYQPQVLKTNQLRGQPEYDSSNQYSFNQNGIADVNNFASVQQAQAPKAVSFQAPRSPVSYASTRNGPFASQAARVAAPSQQQYTINYPGSPKTVLQRQVPKSTFGSNAQRFSGQTQQYAYSP